MRPQQQEPPEGEGSCLFEAPDYDTVRHPTYATAAHASFCNSKGVGGGFLQQVELSLCIHRDSHS